jgi:ethanolamine ammonia-lyase small subunit
MKENDLMNESDIKQLVREIMVDMNLDAKKSVLSPKSVSVEPNIDAEDISALDMQKELYVEHPVDRDAYMEMKSYTPARIGTGRAGPRPHYKALLRFRADHAAAMDAVFNDVSEQIIQEMGLFAVKSSATDRDAFLMDPNIGRLFDKDVAAEVQKHCASGPQVQIVVCDGLSSTAVERNIRELLPALLQGLKISGLSVGTSLFVQYGRVGIMDEVTSLLKSEVTLNLLGERPGLVTNESLSCYMTYKGYPGMAESGRTVVSNIYTGGTPPSEAGAFIANIAKKMIDTKTSGMELKL